MSSKVIQAALIADFTDRTAAAVMAANPGVFASEAEVPEYLYMSLKTMYLGSLAPSGDWADRVSEDVGTGRSDPRGGIIVSSSGLVPSYCRMERTTNIEISDVAGAEYSQVKLILYTPRHITDLLFMHQVMLRTRFVLDYFWRGERSTFNNLVSPGLDVSTDPTIDDSMEYRCFYVYTPNALRAADNVMEFEAHYARKVFK